jgi:hypothetical protein
MGWVINATPPLGRFTPGKETRYPFHRKRSGPQGRSGRVLKTLRPPGFDPRTVKPVASRYPGPLLVVLKLLLSVARAVHAVSVYPTLYG